MEITRSATPADAPAIAAIYNNWQLENPGFEDGGLD
jgi:hypothetical protein